LVSLHEYNERDKAIKLLDPVSRGATLALISDAGTPLISDPGYHLVRFAIEQGIRVVPIPGASALIAALSVSELPTDKFSFEGFLSAKTAARHKQLENLVKEQRTLIFFEAPHRILSTLKEMVNVLGKLRKACIGRELTKTFETIRHGNLANLFEWVENDAMQQRGEIVIIVAGAEDLADEGISIEAKRVLKILLEDLSVKQAASLAAKITGVRRHLLYEYALSLS
jgi:16S rRNA (cytidine1402-2'-O)-methyltransferase